MNTEHALYYLKKLKRKYLLLKLMEIMLWALSATALTYGVISFTSLQQMYMLTPPIIGVVTFFFVFRKQELHLLNEARLIKFINRRYPELEESADLLIKDKTQLSTLEQLQLEKTIAKFNEIYPIIKLPHQLGQMIIFFSISLSITLLLTSFHLPINLNKSLSVNDTEGISTIKSTALPVSIKVFSIQVTPPSYTNLSSSKSENPELIIPAASHITWSITFTNSIQKANLIFPNRDTLKLASNKSMYVGSRTLAESGFYQIQWKNEAGDIKTSDYYKIQVIQDQAPEISIPDLPQATEFSVTDKLSFAITSVITDDYSIQDAYIIATVSKGSGESIKFREEKLSFTSPPIMRGKQLLASRTIDLVNLGLEPGDELYFYAEAIDNRQPMPNRSRTETYFITLQDTASENTSVEAGLGIDLMPEYFRSQRQIIIDTEKLLKDRKKISAHAFKSTSNELGYDQKVLRLKYGEFLGEEFETRIGPAESQEESSSSEGDNIAAKYGHVHDKENEHNLVEDKKQGSKNQQHDHVETGDGKEESPMNAYIHVHDDPEEATFFLQSVRAKLKAALTQMWDAELYLRLYEPEKSLPFQYKALKLLKEVSNDSRIYVHKTGFDPPPIKEEKRLSGDFSDIRNTKHTAQLTSPEAYPGIRTALTITETLIEKHSTRISTKEKRILMTAGNELASLALKQPGRFLEALSLIKELNDDEIKK